MRAMEFAVNDRVEVLRTSGKWTKAAICSVECYSYVVKFVADATLRDWQRGYWGYKTIFFSCADTYLKKV